MQNVADNKSGNPGAIVEKMKQAHVLIVGDIMLDRFVYGHVERISPESPVPILQIAKEHRMLGGAGNVLSNLSGLGVCPLLLAVVGDDEEGRNVRTLVESRGADGAGLLTLQDRPTTVKTRFLAGHQQLLRADFEKTGDLSPETEQALIARIGEYIDRVQAVILSDYGKGVLTGSVISAVIRAARERNLAVLVDPKGRDYGKYRGADIVTPNKKELSEATEGLPTSSDEDVIKAAEKLISENGIGAVIATRSQDGMTLVRGTPDGTGFEAPLHYRAAEVEVFDVSGAGDTVIATVAAGLAAGASYSEAVALANVAGGIVVQKVGTAPIRAAELAAALENACEDIGPVRGTRSGGPSGRAHALLSWEDAAEQIRRWQARGLKVGFTNGCFDILHPGHVSLFAAARAACDRLLVGLNSDSSVRRLKGPERPVNDERSRAMVIGALGTVDGVILFGDDPAEDDKPVALMKKLLPDIVFKGGDYTLETVVGADFVMSYGGQVRIIPLEEGHSTTGIIGRMKKEAAG